MGIKHIKYFKWVISLLLFSFLIFSTSSISFAEEKENILSFGADTRGKTDQTEFIQKAIDYQSDQGGGIVFIPKGVYLIDAVKSIILKDKVILEFEEGAILKALPSNNGHYQIIRIHDVSNVGIVGSPKIVGERSQHIGTSGEWGMGISIRGARNVVVENAEIIDCWGDAIYIGSTVNQNFSENVLIKSPLLDNNRRQGITVISVKKLEIIDAEIYRTNGTNPQSAITIEPNNDLEHLEDIKIVNLTSRENILYGVQIYLKYFAGSANLVNIYIDSLKNIKDPKGVGVRLIENVKGQIVVGGYYHLSEKEIVPKPIVNPITNKFTSLKGTALSGNIIVVRVGKSVIGQAKATNGGKFTVTIPKQINGTALSVTASDAFGNVSKETIVTVEAEKFFDIEVNNWYYNEILFLAEKNVVQGFPNGSFQPNKNTTRAEAAKMIAVALSIPASSHKSEYSDLESGHWASNSIASVTSAGLFNGYTDGSFRPDKNITRAEMAKVLALAYDLKPTNVQIFKDVPSTHWASKSVSGIYQNGITIGYPDNTFKPNMATTRAEFSVFLARALNKELK